MNKQISVYKRHRFPDAVISRAVWLYYRFSLSFREVEQFLSFHGVLNNLFRQQRHLMSAKNYRALRVIDIWSFDSYTGIGRLATDRRNTVFVC